MFLKLLPGLRSPLVLQCYRFDLPMAHGHLPGIPPNAKVSTLPYDDFSHSSIHEITYTQIFTLSAGKGLPWKLTKSAVEMLHVRGTPRRMQGILCQERHYLAQSSRRGTGK